MKESEWKPTAYTIGPGLIGRGRQEYLVVHRPYIVNQEGHDADVTLWLNDMASDRWRLISIVSFVYFFERELMER
jgi:hypothetical protein